MPFKENVYLWLIILNPGTISINIYFFQSRCCAVAWSNLSSCSQVVLTISKPGEKGEVPVGVIVGSSIAGLVLLALAVGLLWKVSDES